MSYFNTQFQGASMPMTDAMRTRDFIARQKQQDDQRREKSKILAEDQKRLGMIAQGLGLEKGEVDSLSRGELQGFIDSEINKKNQIDQIQQRQFDLQKFLREAQNEDAKNKINMLNAKANLNNSLIAMSKNEADADKAEQKVQSDIKIVEHLKNNYNNPEFRKNYPGTFALFEAGAGNADISEFYKKESGNISESDSAEDIINKSDLTLATETAKNYADWVEGGGFVKAEQKVKVFRNVVKQLESGEVETGKIINLFSDAFNAYLGNADGVALQQSVNRIIALNLKDTLGAQFTENEAKQLMERSFDPKLPNQFNIAKLNQAIIEIVNEEDFKLQYYNVFKNDPSKLREFKYDSKNPAFVPGSGNNVLPSGNSYQKFNNLNLPGGNVTTTPSAPTPPAVVPQQPGIVLPQNFQQNAPLNPGSLPNSFMPPVSPVKDINQMLNQSLQKNSVVK